MSGSFFDELWLVMAGFDRGQRPACITIFDRVVVSFEEFFTA
ncbi:MAG: hypothetical protein ACYS19_20300 [Planctomycetota bacterium]|jgi:hypothetical protein